MQQLLTLTINIKSITASSNSKKTQIIIKLILPHTQKAIHFYDGRLQREVVKKEESQRVDGTITIQMIPIKLNFCMETA